MSELAWRAASLTAGLLAVVIAAVLLVIAWPFLALAVALDNRSLGLPWFYGFRRRRARPA